MKNLCPFFLALTMLLLLTACFNTGRRVKGNGRVETQTRNIGELKIIKVLGSMDVQVSPGEPSVRVEADGNILPLIITEVNEGALVIRTEENTMISTENDIKVYVTTPLLTGVTVAGSGNVMAKGDFDNGEKMKFKIAGSGNINMDVNAPRVEADIAASGDLQLGGKTRDLEVNIGGSGNFEGTDLKAENAKVKIAGSGDVFLFADVKLDAKIVGSGNVKYKGNAVVSKSIMGSGSISKLP